MNKGAIFSALLHVALITLLIMGLPDLWKNDLKMPPMMMVEMITPDELSQKTSPQKIEKKKPKIVPKKPTPKEPEKEVEKPAEKSLDDLFSEADKTPIPKKKKNVEKKKPQKKPIKKRAKKKTRDFNSLLNNIEELDQNETVDALNEDDAVELSSTVSSAELRAIERQIQSKWSELLGSHDDVPVVTAVAQIHADGTIQNAKITKSGVTRISKIAAERAERALNHFRHTPLRLSPAKLKELAGQTFIIHFRPSSE